jgi:hypothetical protein
MSGHWRLCVAAFLFVADLAISPASSNPLTDLLNPPPKEEAAAPAPVREQCLLQPGRSTSPGQHWVYHLEGHRKCWFQAAASSVLVTKLVHRHAEKQPVSAPEENEAALRKKSFADARAQLLSAAPADASQPTPPAPEAADTASVPANGAATPMPAAPSTVAEPTIDQLTPEHATRHPVNVEMLLAAAPLASDTVASSVPAATPGAPSVPEEDQWESMATWAGIVLIALGLVCLLGGSLLASRFRDVRVAPVRRA